MGLVEAMISLAISAALLAAVAGAYSASSAAIEGNDQFFRASQGSRVSMTRLLHEVRHCSSIDVYTDHLNLMTADNEDCTYRYDATARQLKLVLNDREGRPEYVLATDVTSATFAVGATQPNNVAPVTVTFIVQVGNQQVRLSGSAVPRSGIAY